MEATRVGLLGWVAWASLCLAACSENGEGSSDPQAGYSDNSSYVAPDLSAGGGGAPSSGNPMVVMGPPSGSPGTIPNPVAPPATSNPATPNPASSNQAGSSIPMAPGESDLGSAGDVDAAAPATPAPAASDMDPSAGPGPMDDPGIAGGSEPSPDPEPAAVTCAGTSSAGNSTGSITSGGEQRSYLVHIPSTVQPDVPAPLVIWFHGILGSGQDYATSGFREVADREGFVLVAPNGIDSAWNVGPCCTARRRNIDDVAFAKALVEKIKETACIDASRIYAAGFSMGGGMSHYLACHAADVFAAVAPSAFDLLRENRDECKPSRPISVASFRNRADNFVYYDGTPNSTPPNTFITQDVSTRINILGAEATLEAWGEIDGCTGSAVDDGPGCRTFKSCEQGVEVTLCAEDNLLAGHHPGPADQMWDRLKRFSMP